MTNPDEMPCYIVILNWNGWRDTIECLESVFRSSNRNYRVIVCDNDSQDSSLTHIQSWADGRLNAEVPSDPRIAALSSPPVSKPISYVTYDRETAEHGGSDGQSDPPLVLIQTGANLGFAGGNNVGLRYALARGDFKYAWLLNNDTVVERNALSRMVARMLETPTVGMCGSTLLYYSRPDIVQGLGGATYNRWLGTTRMLGAQSQYGQPVDRARIEAQLAYISGASMLVSREFLQQIGLMEESYFLYFEEIDWATRATARFQLCFAPESIIFHKEGGSIGTNSAQPKRKSFTADYYGIRSRLAFTRKFFPKYLPSIYLGLVAVLANRVIRGQWDRVKMILMFALHSLFRLNER